jgi:outer membrane immunogenic protein
MKTSAALITAFFVATFSAFAGPERLEGKDMKQVAPPVIEQECNWTGFYIGAHVGYGWNNLKWTDTDTSTFTLESDTEPPDRSGPEVLVEQSANGIIAGGTIGYNYQFGRHWVIGAEGEFSYSDVSDSSSVHTESFTNAFETNSDWVGTFALRAGFAWKKLLFYVKGGGAVTHQEYKLNHTVLDEGSPNPVDRFNADNTWVAPMAGGGIEYMINCHWSVKAEYQAVFLGKDDISGTNVEASTGAESESYEIDLKHQDSVRVGLNYKF